MVHNIHTYLPGGVAYLFMCLPACLVRMVSSSNTIGGMGVENTVPNGSFLTQKKAVNQAQYFILKELEYSTREGNVGWDMLKSRCSSGGVKLQLLEVYCVKNG